ncbi:hypothetical protein KVR01_008840 [Diaporthe batatas]|uniref:uncharacterized protein n=1 Tax=Diaporthe batatas TaxID=748121 RepID=UPI001D03A9B9|nr:uncharacterized protein KVR01_008840 [Diaporthe batatas]KAG8161853.1 hypothetical protein KVR01_008840 [Diaporthe batatas]
MQRFRTICCSCRRRLLADALFRAQAPRLPPWQLLPRAYVSSASEPRPDPGSDNNVDDIVPSIEAAEAHAQQRSGPEAPAQGGGPATPRFRGLDRRRAMRRNESMPKGRSLEIFERVVRKQVDEDNLPSNSAPKSLTALEYYNDLAQLKPMLKRESIETCFEFFLTKVWKNVPPGGRDQILKHRGTIVMARVVEAKMDDWDNEKLPSLSEVTRLLYELDSIHCKRWADSVMSLIRNLVTRSTTKTDYPDAGAYEKSMARKDVLLQDMVDTLIAFNRGRSRARSFRFPGLDEHLLQNFARTGEAIKAIKLLFPHIQGNDFVQIRPVAIASFVVLSDSAHSSLEAQEKAKPFLDPMGKVLASVTVWKTGLHNMFQEHPDVLAYVLSRWDSLISQLRQTNGSKSLSKMTVKGTELNRHGGPDEKYIMQKVNTGLGMRDSDAVEDAWARFWGPDAVPSDERQAELQKMDQVFHHFIMTFTALHKPQRAVEVWESMTRVGAQPNIRTWTSLIEGCRRSKNAVGIENVWRKLQASGLEVDEQAWSARVVGLISCGEPEAGLRALDEMLHQSKLTIAPINAAVAALMRMNAMSAAKKVLDWAAKNNVEPDIMTFNTLLRPLVLQGNTAQIDSLLKMMKAKGVEPDAATYTVLLEGIIGSSKDADPAEQVKSVNNLFAEMDAAGVQANMQTFGRMLYLLLSEPGANSYEAVEAVRRHVRDKGLHMSTQMQTILLDHYFSLNPPNLEAVEDLMNNEGLKWRMFVRRGLDRVFWERVIKGYAAAGETERAFGIFEQVNNIGSAMTLDTLSTLLQALVRAGKMEEARKMVETVKRHRQNTSLDHSEAGSLGHGGQRSRGRYWRHAFWAYALECRLLSPAEWEELQTGPVPRVAGP